METIYVVAIWVLLGIALLALGAVWFYARRRDRHPDELLRARPDLTIGVVIVWGAALSLAALLWAYDYTRRVIPHAWLLFCLALPAAFLGWKLGLRQAEREHLSETSDEEVRK